jgi:hypothetical protein
VSYEQVPPEIEDLLLIVCGNEWPDGDTGQLRSDAVAWRSAAKTLASAEQSANHAAMLAESGFNGQAGTAFTDYWNSLTSGNESFMPLLEQVCGELADSLDQVADQIETVRIDIVTSVIILAAELAWDEAMSFFTAGASEAAAAAEIAATRVTILRLVRKAILQLAEHEIKQTMLQFVIDLIAQGIEKVEHPGMHFNIAEAGDAAINGAVGGAVGFGSGMLFKGLGHGISKIDDLNGGVGRQALARLGEPRAAPGGDDAVGEPAGGRLNRTRTVAGYSGRLLGDIALNVAVGPAEAAAQDAALDGGQVSTSDPQAGAMNGIGNGVFGRLSKVNPGDGPLDTALKRSGGLLSGGLEHLKGMLGHGPGQAPPGEPSDSDTGSVHSQESVYVTAPPTRAPSPVPGAHDVAMEPPPPPGLPGFETVLTPGLPGFETVLTAGAAGPATAPAPMTAAGQDADSDSASVHSQESVYVTAPPTRAPSPVPDIPDGTAESAPPPVRTGPRGLPGFETAVDSSPEAAVEAATETAEEGATAGPRKLSLD